MVHPLRKNIVFPVALHELLCDSTLRAADFISPNYILGLTEDFVVWPDKFWSKQVQETKPVAAKSKCICFLPNMQAWTFWAQFSESPHFPGNLATYTLLGIQGSFAFKTLTALNRV